MTEAGAFFDGLVATLEKEPLPLDLEDEDALERVLIPAVHAYTSEHLGTSDLREILYHHHNPNWSQSKQYQDIAILGRNNTGDIFIRHPSVGTIFIDLKLTKRRQTKWSPS